MGSDRSIEKCLKELKHINEEMTQDGLRMDDALALYRKGLTLVHEAEAVLDGYEQEIRLLEMDSGKSQ